MTAGRYYRATHTAAHDVRSRSRKSHIPFALTLTMRVARVWNIVLALALGACASMTIATEDNRVFNVTASPPTHTPTAPPLQFPTHGTTTPTPTQKGTNNTAPMSALPAVGIVDEGTPPPTASGSSGSTLTPDRGNLGATKATATTTTTTTTTSSPTLTTSTPITPPPRTTTPTATPTTSSEPVETYRRSGNNSPINTTRGRDDQSSTGDQEVNSAPRVIGGREDRNPARNDNDDSEVSSIATTTASSSISRVYRVLKYVVSISAAVSVALLHGFHALAVDERFDWSRFVCAPNTWEFVVFISYAQHLLSLSQMVLVKTPYSLWTMLDGLSWTGFLPYHSSDSAITLPTKATSTALHASSRQLDTILLSGFVAFADRVGVKETDLLERSVTYFVAFVGGLLVCFFVFAAIAKRRLDHYESHPSQRLSHLDHDTRLVCSRKTAMQVCGQLVLFWVCALYPLSALASYEVSMEIRASSFSVEQLILAAYAILGLCLGGMLVIGHAVSSKNQRELREPVQLTAWGCLYADYRHDKRAFFVAPVLVQIASGVVVGSVTSPTVQLSLVIAVHVIFFVVLFRVKPFVKGSVAPWFVVVVTLIKTTNLSIALAAFTAANTFTIQMRASAADAVIYLNAMVVLFWLLRHVAMLVQVVRCLRNGSAERELPVGLSIGNHRLNHQQLQSEVVYYEPTPSVFADDDTCTQSGNTFSLLESYKP